MLAADTGLRVAAPAGSFTRNTGLLGTAHVFAKGSGLRVAAPACSSAASVFTESIGLRVATLAGPTTGVTGSPSTGGVSLWAATACAEGIGLRAAAPAVMPTGEATCEVSIKSMSIECLIEGHSKQYDPRRLRDKGGTAVGCSYGGFVLMHRDGGALAWKCRAQGFPTDRPGDQGLLMASLAYRWTLALRMSLADLDVGAEQTQPTSLLTDSQIRLDGDNCRAIAPRKCAAAGNAADIVTKPLGGPAYVATEQPSLVWRTRRRWSGRSGGPPPGSWNVRQEAARTVPGEAQPGRSRALARRPQARAKASYLKPVTKRGEGKQRESLGYGKGKPPRQADASTTKTKARKREAQPRRGRARARRRRRSSSRRYRVIFPTVNT